jgi:hypothetical protein
MRMEQWWNDTDRVKIEALGVEHRTKLVADE